MQKAIYIVTIKRGAISEPETYYMLAPSPEIAEFRVRRLAKAPKATVLDIHSESESRRMAS